MSTRAAPVRRKAFFFEKKNRKTFVWKTPHVVCRGDTVARRQTQKFFGSFFQKRTLAFLELA
jgi:hypothetical protein